jgi:hypothetical protein
MARNPEKIYGWLIPLGHDGKDAALFPIKRQFYVIGRYYPFPNLNDENP